MAFPGNVVTWGSTNSGQIERPVTLTNVIAAAVGESNSVAVNHDGHVTQWGHEWAPVPSDLTNAVAVSAGFDHTLALRNTGTVAAWGSTNQIANGVPTNLASVRGIAAGWNHNVAVLSNGTVTAWGANNPFPGMNLTNVPPDLTNATSVAAGALHSVGLRGNGTVVAWGWNLDGQTNVPSALSNVAAVAAGGYHSMALLSNGTVQAWGCNTSGECNVPSGLSDVMAIAAGFAHSVALKNDGTVVAWGRNAEGQTNVPSGVIQAQGIAAGGNQSLAMIFSHTVSYPVDISRDLILIYNTNSADSLNVFNYYVQHRQFASNAIVLPIGCTNGEFMTTNEFVTQLLVPWLDWLKLRPISRPRYIVLFLDIPSRMSDRAPGDNLGKVRGSVSFAIRDFTPGIKPYVTHIHMGDTNACKAYIDKLEFFGTNYSPGQVILSASAGGYGNGDYYFDGALRFHPLYGPPEVTNALAAVLATGVSSNLVHFNHSTNDSISSVSNMAGYYSHGLYAYPNEDTTKQDYAVDGRVRFTGNSRWYVITTRESFNGQVLQDVPQGNFIKWFSANAFGGTNYLNTPIGAASHAEEPGPSVTAPVPYFTLWVAGRNFAICAWGASASTVFQAVGDPLVKR